MEENETIRKIDLFMRVRPPAIAKKLKAVKDWSLKIEPKITLVWKWNTVVFQFKNRDLLYLSAPRDVDVKVGFSEGAKLKYQDLLMGGEKIFVRQFLIDATPECQTKFALLLNNALEVSLANSHKKLFAKN